MRRAHSVGPMIYAFEDCELDTERFEIRKDGKVCMVEPKAFDLLRLLIENRDRLVSREEVVSVVWQGRIISDATIGTCVNAARRAVGDNGRDQKFIKTVPRRGFRFVAAVRHFDPPMEGAEGLAVTVDPESRQTARNRPSIAVLPFENMSGDQEQSYFADGIAEDITTALSRFRWFFVIARNSSFSYRGAPRDVRRVAEELDAQYLVEGSVRKAGERVRITVQLIDARTGRTLWADRFDRNLADIFVIQDEITQQIAATIAPAVERSEIQRIVTKPPGSLAAWEYCLQGNALIYDMGSEALLKARDMFAAAIELDPDYSRARSGKAFTYSLGLRFLREKEREAGLRALMAEAKKAVELDDTDSKARVSLALAYMYAIPPKPDYAVAEAGEAVALNPDDPQANSVFGVALSLSANRFEDGIAWIEKAVSMNPRDPINHLYLSQLALAHLCAGHYETAEAVAREAVRRRRGFIESHIALASALGHQHRPMEAKMAVGEFETVAAEFVTTHLVFSDAVKSHVIHGLEKANLGAGRLISGRDNA